MYRSGRRRELNSSLRRELLLFFGVVLTGAVLVAAVGLLVVLPFLSDVGQAILYVLALLSIDLAALYIFGRAHLRKILLKPIDRLVSDARRVSGGEYTRRLEVPEIEELASLADSMNEMAARLYAEQQLLAENVRSLERTNRELVAARDQVIRTARMASIGSLASGIAHEIGNPLGAIIGYVDVAKRRAGNEGQDTELLESIRTEADRIDRIVRSLLDFVRGRGGVMGASSVEEVSSRVRGVLEGQGRLQGVELDWVIPLDLPRVSVEAQQLEQILLNLLLNAEYELIERGGGRIRVEAAVTDHQGLRAPIRREDDPPTLDYAHRRRRALDLGGRPATRISLGGTVVRIRVEDDGPGLPPEGPDRVFDPFFSTKPPGKGTGLGLALCAQLLEDVGGSIEAANREGGGAVFTLYLPIESLPE